MNHFATGVDLPHPRFAYLLLSHKEPAQTEDLVHRILALSSNGQVVIHHDAATDSVPFPSGHPERVHAVPRRTVLWGDWSIVEATLDLIDRAVRHLEADWLVIISGEHRPVTDLEVWERGVAASGADAFVEAQPLPPRLGFGRRHETEYRYLARCRHQWRVIPEPGNAAVRKALGAVWKISRSIQPLYAMEYSHRRRGWFLGLPRQRKPLRHVNFYKGTQWIAMDRRAAEVVLGTPTSINDWFRRTHIADETYLQTILYNAPGLDVRNAVVTYVPDGAERPASPGPLYLDLTDLPAMWASGAAFARKVDPRTRPTVIETIDTRVDDQRSASTDAPAWEHTLS